MTAQLAWSLRVASRSQVRMQGIGNIISSLSSCLAAVPLFSQGGEMLINRLINQLHTIWLMTEWQWCMWRTHRRGTNTSNQTQHTAGRASDQIWMSPTSRHTKCHRSGPAHRAIVINYESNKPSIIDNATNWAPRSAGAAAALRGCVR